MFSLNYNNIKFTTYQNYYNDTYCMRLSKNNVLEDFFKY